MATVGDSGMGPTSRVALTTNRTHPLPLKLSRAINFQFSINTTNGLSLTKTPVTTTILTVSNLFNFSQLKTLAFHLAISRTRLAEESCERNVLTWLDLWSPVYHYLHLLSISHWELYTKCKMCTLLTPTFRGAYTATQGTQGTPVTPSNVQIPTNVKPPTYVKQILKNI